MKQYVVAHPWHIIEETFDPSIHPITESLMSIGNGRMGQRANMEEAYTSESLLGNYIGGVYYPDKTKVGWWKNGYPEYFAKVLNAVNWIKLDLHIDNHKIDLATANIISYNRSLDMRHGLLNREVKIKTASGKRVSIVSTRFYSIVDLDRCYMQYTITAQDEAIDIDLKSHLDFNVRNSDSNYDEDFWADRDQDQRNELSWVSAVTKKTDFKVCAAVKNYCNVSGQSTAKVKSAKCEGKVFDHYNVTLLPGQALTLTKCVAITSSFVHGIDDTQSKAIQYVAADSETSYKKALQMQKEAWIKRWDKCDIQIEGDEGAQQGIRFNLFQLYQTYSGEDARLNIGPKGFTGEKYGGSTYWDTEAYCLQFYLSTGSSDIARNLLIYRHNHLAKAIENAAKLGFSKGAALYPMVTMNGEECHNEWEITFEEIHRNGAIAYAIHNYVRYTEDQDYLRTHGLEVLIAISRFWAQRVHKSPSKDLYVILGVTGPNEYENNVNNNWYTNYIARWCLSYTSEVIEWMSNLHQADWLKLKANVSFLDEELSEWASITQNMYLPKDEEKGIFLQQDGFLDKEDINTADLPLDQRPLNQKWSWDRILRSPFIKQADVLQGMYFFQEDFSTEQLAANFNYYEPKTVHESSLSPCVHAILAASLGKKDKAYEMYLRTSRLDLDNYNNDTEDGCHITSMAGTWLSIVEGFAGMRVIDGMLSFRPFVPDQWNNFSFKINFRGTLLHITLSDESFTIFNDGSDDLDFLLLNDVVSVAAHQESVFNIS